MNISDINKRINSLLKQCEESSTTIITHYKKISSIQGQIGELKVHEILAKFPNIKIYPDAIIPYENHSFEIDFVVFYLGIFYLIEVKNWRGAITPGDEYKTVRVGYFDEKEQYHENIRNNPRHTLALSFIAFKEYMKNKYAIDISHDNTKKICVFADEEFYIVKDYQKGNSTTFLNIDKLEHYFDLLRKNENAIDISNEKIAFPSWDLICYFKKGFKNNIIQENDIRFIYPNSNKEMVIKLSDVRYLYQCIETKNRKYILGLINGQQFIFNDLSRRLSLFDEKRLNIENVEFIYFNNLLRICL